MAPEFPAFSDEERNRRWATTRKGMARDGVQALVLLPAGLGDASVANLRYLSQAGTADRPAALVFPSGDEPTLIVSDAEETDRWRDVSWVADIRPSEGGAFGAVAARRLRELGLQDATIGVPHLSGAPGLAEGPLLTGPLGGLMGALPNARFVDAAAPLDEQRSTKSEEEVSVLDRAVAVAEAGLFTLGYHVCAGMPQPEALGILQAAVLRAGGDVESRVTWDCSPVPGRPRWRAPGVAIQRGDIVQPDVAPRLAGYGVHEVHPVCVGKPPQHVYDMFELCLQIFNEALPLVRSGAPLADVVDLAARLTDTTPFQASVIARGSGLGHDLPRSGSVSFGEGQVLTLGPILAAPDETRITFQTTIAVTPEGGQRLGRRPLELMLTSRSFMSAYTGWRRTPEPEAPWLAER